MEDQKLPGRCQTWKGDLSALADFVWCFLPIMEWVCNDWRCDEICTCKSFGVEVHLKLQEKGQQERKVVTLVLPLWTAYHLLSLLSLDGNLGHVIYYGILVPASHYADFANTFNSRIAAWNMISGSYDVYPIVTLIWQAFETAGSTTPYRASFETKRYAELSGLATSIRRPGVPTKSSAPAKRFDANSHTFTLVKLAKEVRNK